MTSTDEILNHANKWEAEATREEFTDAVQYCGTRPNLKLSEEVQRRLFGFHCRATRGAPPQDAPPKDLVEEQWKAWLEIPDMSKQQAMQGYIDLLVEHEPDFMLGDLDDEPATKPASELPPGILEQLATAGIKETGPNAAQRGDAADHSGIFAAAREGRKLDSFLPDGLNAVDEDGNTPLIHAVDANQVEAVDQLLQARAAVDHKDSQGQTALHYAALLGGHDVARKLLLARADPSIKDEDGQTPADVAREEGEEDLVKLLQDGA